jgi:hypothetical protein
MVRLQVGQALAHAFEQLAQTRRKVPVSALVAPPRVSPCLSATALASFFASSAASSMRGLGVALLLVGLDQVGLEAAHRLRQRRRSASARLPSRRESRECASNSFSASAYFLSMATLSGAFMPTFPSR